MLTLRGVLANVASCIDLDQEGGRHTNAHRILHPRELLLIHGGGFVKLQSQLKASQQDPMEVDRGRRGGTEVSVPVESSSNVID